MAARTKKLPPLEALVGEATAALLAILLTIYFGCSSFHLEGDFLLFILAINKSQLFIDWPNACLLVDCHQQFSLFNV